MDKDIDTELKRLVTERDAGKLTAQQWRERRKEIDRRIVAFLFPEGLLIQ
ncbi:MAG: hypothetical protein JWN75_1210 [Candidatus Saccharibacteria bacterium]|nr:hypothetical protein [Candidatus Saccharibacteria bacterium]